MSYKLSCDNKVCGAEIESADSGRPQQTAKRRIYCERCAAHVDAVETELRKQATLRALTLSEEIEALREKLMAEYMPPQLSESTAPRKGIQHGWTIEVPA